MTTYFVDTSALVKRYIIEIGSKWVLSWIEPQANNVIAVSEIAYVEIRSAFARRVRDGSLSSGNAQRLKSDAEAHLRMEYLITPVDTGLLQIAGQMVDSYTLRTLDSTGLCNACTEHFTSTSHFHQRRHEPAGCRHSRRLHRR